MPKQVKKSGLTAKYGDDIRKAHEAHKDDELRLGAGGDLPAGIENGIAQLVDCKFDVYKDGNNAGEYYFYAAGVVKEPKKVGAVPVEGLRTSVMEAVCETTTRAGEVRSVEYHIDRIYNELRKLGVDTAELDPADLESVAAALKEAQPHFRFRTWQGKPTPQYPDPRVNHDWRGVVENYEEDGEGTEDAVEDATGDDDAETLAARADAGDHEAQLALTKQAQQAGVDPDAYDTWAAVAEAIAEGGGAAEEEEAEEEEAAEGEEASEGEISLQDLGDMADEGDEEAIDKLTEAAEEAELDPDEYPTWKELADALVAARTEGGEEEEEETPPPEKGDVMFYKPPKAKKALECEITAVLPKAQKVNLKALDDGRTFKGVAWDELSAE